MRDCRVCDPCIVKVMHHRGHRLCSLAYCNKAFWAHGQNITKHISFLTAGGGSVRPMSVMCALPIRLGRLEFKTDMRVTPDDCNMLIGEDWLQMAQADLLLSKGQLHVRLDAEQWGNMASEVNNEPQHLLLIAAEGHLTGSVREPR